MTPPSAATARLPTLADMRRTAAYIASCQRDSGAIPWEIEGESAGKIEVWDHVECAMALLVAGRDAEAAGAWEWLVRAQRADGTWPLEWRGERVTDPGVEANMCAYVAVGVWHHWLSRRDEAFVARLWPVVAAALEAVVAMQLPGGAIAWCRGAGGTAHTALVTGSASIHHALGCGVQLAAVLGRPQPGWARAAARVAAALRAEACGDAGAFEDKRRWSMDWYYPVLGGVLRGPQAQARLASRWEDFVVPGLGIRCVADRPWVTGAETCELALTLESIGHRAEAVRLVADVQHLREDDGSYHTGYVFADGLRWPVERSTWTSAAVVLAVDAVCGLTPGADAFRT